MKIAYAVVQGIVQHESMVYGHFDGHILSQHEVPVSEVSLSGGFKFYALSEMNDDGSVYADNGMKIEVGDRFRVIALPDGIVREMSPERTAHLPVITLEDIAKVN